MKSSTPSKIVLITGCSSGIGAELVRDLAATGYSVIATARQPESLANLPAELKLTLDVTDPASIAEAVRQVLDRFGRIDVLVNNAGYAIRGAIEEAPLDGVLRMFDANVFGVMRMIQAVSPSMRRQRAGRIINIGSIAGKIVVPVNGTYSATKYALEAISDAARLEMAPFGIQVVLIEPGNIRTQFLATAQEHARGILDLSDSPYKALYAQYQKVSIELRKREADPRIVAGVVRQAIESSRPRARYVVAVPFLNQLSIYLGDAIRDRVFKRLFKW